MKYLLKIWLLLQWPAVFLVLAALLDDKWPVVAFTLALVFRRDLSAVIRRRRLAVNAMGFKGTVWGNDSPPRRRSRNPPSSPGGSVP